MTDDAIRQPFDAQKIPPEQVKKHPELFDLPKTGRPELDNRLRQVGDELNRDFQNQPRQQERRYQRARYKRSLDGED